MADKRISQLVERINIANNDVLPIVASGATTTNKVTVSTLQDWMQSNLDVGVTSVGLSMPSAFVVSNSPVTASGNISVTGAGTVSQYIRGDGSLADFPSGGGGGGSSVNYYLNGSVSQGTIGGIAYQEMNRTPILGAGTDFTIAADGYIASFITDAGDPALLEIPAGNWNFETYLQASSGGGTPSFYIELYKVDSGGTATLIASNSGSPELIAFGTAINPYFSALAVPTTSLALTDRLALRYYVTHSGRTITLHTENATLCQIITTFTTGLTALNGLTAQVQNFATGTSGTDFAISSSVNTHTFNLPDASASARGVVTTGSQTFAGAKTFNSSVTASSLIKTGGTSSQFLMADGSVNTSVLASGAYLPLAGGTLTGTLNGTSANFTNNVTIDRSLSTLGNALTITKGSDSDQAWLAFQQGAAADGVWRLGYTGDPYDFRINVGSSSSIGTQALRIFETTQNVVIGTSTSDNLSRLQVGGAATFSSSVTASSLIRSGGTSSQFLKADGSVDSSSYLTTGTAASTYLPLTGGTLTGPLNGTSASFSGLLNLDNSTSLALSINSTTNNPYIRFQQSGATKFFIGERSAVSGDGGTGYDIYAVAGNDIRFFPGAAKALTLASTGAATFSSSVTANGAKPQLYVIGDSSNGAGIFLNTLLSGANRRNWGIFTEENVDGDFAIKCSTAAGGSAISGNTRLQISRDGNVGIGTASPNIYNLTNTRNLTLVNDAGYGVIASVGSSGNGGEIDFGTSSIRHAAIASLDGSNLGFYTNGSNSGTGVTEKMRIISGGFTKASNTGTYLNATAPYHELVSNQVGANVLIFTHTHSSDPYGPYVYFQNAAPNNSTNYFLSCGDNVSDKFIARSNGGLANFQANNVNLSDERTKKDIEPLESYWDKFKAIEIVKFKYKDQTHDDYNIGVIAQQVEAVAPEFVDVDGWETKPKLDEEGNEIVSEEEPLKSIYTADLHHATIKVLQEAMAKIEKLETEIDSLKNQMQ